MGTYGAILGQRNGVQTVNSIPPDVDGDVNLDKWNLDKNYPIGSIYISANSTSPASLFGGNWEKIEGKFLLSSSSKYALGSNGGEETHILSTDEMPSHTHKLKARDGNFVAGSGYPYQFPQGVEQGYSTSGAERELFDQTYYAIETGGGQPHNNMPPYLVVAVWKRIS